MFCADINNFIENQQTELFEVLHDLCLIPAPSHEERERAEFCKRYLEACGAESVYIDEAMNVVCPVCCDGSDGLTVVAAHTDTVFPDRTPMPYHDDGERVWCPGVGDDTASLAVLLLTAKFCIQNQSMPVGGVLFVCNSCEEGLGNLKGTRQIFKDYEGRIARFISFDSQLNVVADRCAGSHRYEVQVMTEGGHSYLDFGKKNAICELAKIVNEIDKIDVPKEHKTTYNVGIIHGGTSVNTIAQHATMLCEYRSENKDCLAFMKEQFHSVFADAEKDDVSVNVTVVGDRPCSDIEAEKIENLKQLVIPVIEGEIQKQVVCESSSTDCNIPLSLGIPALCMGVYYGGGMHTREEWIEKKSLPVGLSVAIKTVLKLAGLSA